MSSAVSTFEVVDLARFQTREFDQQRSQLAAAERAAGLLRGRAVSILGALFASFVDTHARKLAQQTVWFRGARAEIEERAATREIDADDSLRQMLDKMEQDLGSIQNHASDAANRLRTTDGRQRGTFRDALDRLACTAAELSVEVREFKGTVQALDANFAALQRARRVSVTAEQVDGELDRAFR